MPLIHHHQQLWKLQEQFTDDIYRQPLDFAYQLQIHNPWQVTDDILRKSFPYKEIQFADSIIPCKRRHRCCPRIAWYYPDSHPPCQCGHKGNVPDLHHIHSSMWVTQTYKAVMVVSSTEGALRGIVRNCNLFIPPFLVIFLKFDLYVFVFHFLIP